MDEIGDEVELHTDGGCLDNPGPGGYGIVLHYKNARKEPSGGFRMTTNNRMELIAGLEALKRECRVVLRTDSEYVAKNVDRAEKWRENGWKRHRNRRVANADLWERLLDSVSRHEVRVEWTKGHAGDPDNERCHRLASRAMRMKMLPADEGYEGER